MKISALISHSKYQAVRELAVRRLLSMTEDEKISFLLDIFIEKIEETHLTADDLLLALYPQTHKATS